MEYIIKHKASVKDLCSVDFHTLTTNGPYIDAHFGPLTKKKSCWPNLLCKTYI